MVVLGATLIAIFLLINGSYVFTKGRMAPRIGKYPETGEIMSYSRSIPIAVMYLGGGAAILVLLFNNGNL